jgi:hypothetical protein
MGTLDKQTVWTITLALAVTAALAGCGPAVAGPDGGTGDAAVGNCTAGSGNVNYEECVQPLVEAENCATCHALPSIPMDLLEPIQTAGDLEQNYNEIVARSSAGDDSLLILYLWDGPRNPDPSHPVVFSSLDEPVAQMLLDWISCPILHAGDPCTPKTPPASDAIESVLMKCNPQDPATLTFVDCVEPVLTYYGPVGTGTGCMSCHNAEIGRPDVRNFYIIPNDWMSPTDPLTNINYMAVTNYENNDVNNNRRLDLVVNGANPENNRFLFNPFSQDYNNCLFGNTGAFPVTYNNANGLPNGTHPNTAFACDYTNNGAGWVEGEALAEIWYYWALNGAAVR